MSERPTGVEEADLPTSVAPPVGPSSGGGSSAYGEGAGGSSRRPLVDSCPECGRTWGWCLHTATTHGAVSPILQRFTSKGDLGVPAGDYLVEIWPGEPATLAWREDPSRVWCPPIDAEVQP